MGREGDSGCEQRVGHARANASRGWDLTSTASFDTAQTTQIWFVIPTLGKIRKSLGMIISNIWRNKHVPKPPASKPNPNEVLNNFPDHLSYYALALR